MQTPDPDRQSDSDATALRDLALPISQTAIVLWLVVASRILTHTRPNAAGALDDLALVAFAAALQCATLRLPSRRARIALSLLQTSLLAALVFMNVVFFTFFETNLSIASLTLAGIVTDASTSVAELITPASAFALLLAPIGAQALLLLVVLPRRASWSVPHTTALALLFSGMILAGLAGAGRAPVFLFAEHNPTLALARDGLARIARPFTGATTEVAGTANEVLALLNREGYAGYEFAGSADRPLLQRPIETTTPGGKMRPNVVIILMESVRALEMQGRFRELPVTPRLNTLESESLVFPNVYANGMTTVDAEFSVLCSALPVVNEAPVYVRKPELSIRCLPEILAELGYSTHWISAYKSSYANKARFLTRHGVEQIHDRSSMSPLRAEHPPVGWGMGDVDMFSQAAEKMDSFREPFFAEIMTLSNHHPFDHDYDLAFPASFERVAGNEHYRRYLQGIHYTDHAVGGFLDSIRSKPWFDRTLFVILGDHAVRAYPDGPDGASLGAVLETEVYFRSRLQLFAPKLLQPGTNPVLGSQIDIAPTLLDWLGIRTENSFMGVSLLADVAPRRRFALMSIGHVFNMRMADQYCYSVGYSCFEGVFPRCPKGVEPTSEGHTCFESEHDLLERVALVDADPTRRETPRPLDALERHRILDRADRIMRLNAALIEQGRYR